MNGESETKVCRRCNHEWNSHTASPVRCPNCGTYRWSEEPTRYECVSCGHTWTSRTKQVPARCPRCKTRCWRDGPVSSSSGSVRRTTTAFVSSEVEERYAAGEGCVKISMEMQISLESVIEILKSGSEEGHGLRMRAGPGPRGVSHSSLWSILTTVSTTSRPFSMRSMA